MGYDFNQYVQRIGTNTSKWDNLQKRFGKTDILPMWVADMDFLSPDAVIDALKRRAEHGVFGYTIRSDAYFQSIVDWFSLRHQWNLQKEWIENSPGVVTALAALIRAFTHQGDQVLIQTPVYYPFFHVIQRQGRELVKNPLRYENGRYEMDFVDLEMKLSQGNIKMMILCSPHNPVGRVWQVDELIQLGELCIKYNVLVISDEIHCDLIYPGHVHTPFASISDAFRDVSVTCVAPSKTFNLAGLHTSAVVISNPQLREIYVNEMQESAIGEADVFGTTALEAAYRYGASWLDELLVYLEGNITFLNQYLTDMIPEIRLVPVEGTYLAWLDCRNLGMDDKELNQFFLNQAKIGLNSGAMFGDEGNGFQRMNFGCPRSILEQGLEQIATAVKGR